MLIFTTFVVMNISVAIVEDNLDIRKALEQIINMAGGFELVCSCENGEDALIKLPIFEPHVVLMDIHLPGKSGIQCVQELKEKKGKTLFVMCTSVEDSDSVFQALKAGACGYLLKITTPAKLLESISEAYNGGSPMSSHIARKVVTSFQQVDQFPELEKLSDREKEILGLLSKGFRYKEIAAKLFISTETVRKHIRNIYEKLEVNSRTDAINKVYQRNA